MFGCQAGVSKGASHGIGHVLGGTAGVPHGYTSCIMLPHVLRFNASVNADRQALVSEALGRPGEPAADVVADLVAGLGLPGRLRDAGVKQDQLDQIAPSRCTTVGCTPTPSRSTAPRRSGSCWTRPGDALIAHGLLQRRRPAHPGGTASSGC